MRARGGLSLLRRLSGLCGGSAVYLAWRKQLEEVLRGRETFQEALEVGEGRPRDELEEASWALQVQERNDIHIGGDPVIPNVVEGKGQHQLPRSEWKTGRVMTRLTNSVNRLMVGRVGMGISTQPELESSLRRIAEEDDLDVKICFFIDGLDEYTGDHMGICQTLKRLSQSPSIKMCFSSRPWNVFEDTLGDAPEAKLYMHELTHQDIREYTESVLCSHPRWPVLEQEASRNASRALVDEIVSRSNGVFLWVTLVLRLLREGLSNDDSLSDLQRRLSGFPSDLGPFFQHILSSVDPFYSQKMAGTLLLALHAKQPLAIEIYMFHDLEYDNEDYAFKYPDVSELIPTSMAELQKLFSTVFRRINGRCKGLLERNGDKMEFLHRTVYDFLKTVEMTEFLSNRAKTNFSASLSIFRAFVAWTKRTRFSCRSITVPGANPFVHLQGFMHRMRIALPYAKVSDKQGENSAALTAAILDNMESSILIMLSRGQLPSIDSATAKGVYRHLTLEAGIESYLRKRLKTRTFLDGLSSYLKFRSLLFSVLIQPALNGWTLDHFFYKDPEGNFLRWVREALLDPKYSLGNSVSGQAENFGASSWERFLLASIAGVGSTWTMRFRPTIHAQPDADSTRGWFIFGLENDIYGLMLQNGADPNTMFRSWGRPFVFLPSWLLLLLFVVDMPSLPQYIDHFERVLNLLMPLESNGLSDGTADNGYLNIERWSEWLTEFPFVTVEDPTAHQIIVRLFAGPLSKFPETGKGYETARGWFQTALPESCHRQLEESARSLRLKRETTKALGLFKREMREEKSSDVPRNRRKRRRG